MRSSSSPSPRDRATRRTGASPGWPVPAAAGRRGPRPQPGGAGARRGRSRPTRRRRAGYGSPRGPAGDTGGRGSGPGSGRSSPRPGRARGPRGGSRDEPAGPGERTGRRAPGGRSGSRPGRRIAPRPGPTGGRPRRRGGGPAPPRPRPARPGAPRWPHRTPPRRGRSIDRANAATSIVSSRSSSALPRASVRCSRSDPTSTKRARAATGSSSASARRRRSSATTSSPRSCSAAWALRRCTSSVRRPASSIRYASSRARSSARARSRSVPARRASSRASRRAARASAVDRPASARSASAARRSSASRSRLSLASRSERRVSRGSSRNTRRRPSRIPGAAVELVAELAVREGLEGGPAGPIGSVGDRCPGGRGVGDRGAELGDASLDAGLVVEGDLEEVPDGAGSGEGSRERLAQRRVLGRDPQDPVHPVGAGARPVGLEQGGAPVRGALVHGDRELGSLPFQGRTRSRLAGRGTVEPGPELGDPRLDGARVSQVDADEIREGDALGELAVAEPAEALDLGPERIRALGRRLRGRGLGPERTGRDRGQHEPEEQGSEGSGWRGGERSPGGHRGRMPRGPEISRRSLASSRWRDPAVGRVALGGELPRLPEGLPRPGIVAGVGAGDPEEEPRSPPLALGEALLDRGLDGPRGLAPALPVEVDLADPQVHRAAAGAPRGLLEGRERTIRLAGFQVGVAEEGPRLLVALHPSRLELGREDVGSSLGDSRAQVGVNEPADLAVLGQVSLSVSELLDRQRVEITARLDVGAGELEPVGLLRVEARQLLEGPGHRLRPAALVLDRDGELEPGLVGGARPGDRLVDGGRGLRPPAHLGEGGRQQVARPGGGLRGLREPRLEGDDRLVPPLEGHEELGEVEAGGPGRALGERVEGQAGAESLGRTLEPVERRVGVARDLEGQRLLVGIGALGRRELLGGGRRLLVALGLEVALGPFEPLVGPRPDGVAGAGDRRRGRGEERERGGEGPVPSP